MEVMHWILHMGLALSRRERQRLSGMAA